MARKKNRPRTQTVQPQSIIVQRSASRSPTRRARAVGLARRVRRSAGNGAAKYATTATIAGAAVIGYLDGTGKLDQLPEVMGSRMITLGLIGYAANKYSKNSQIKAAGNAAMTIAAFDLAKGIGATGSLPKAK